MKNTAHVVAAMFVACVLMPRAVSADDRKSGPPSVVTVRVVGDAGVVHGTAALIRRDDRDDDTILYFLTSAHLLRAADRGQRLSDAIQLRLDETCTVEAKREDVLFAGNDFVDVAIVRVSGARIPSLHPRPLQYDAPPLGSVFLISAVDETGSVKTVSQHVGFESTLLVTGDRVAPDLAGCTGAPAIGPSGIFGVVRECEAGRPPVVSLLAMAQSVLQRYVPRLTSLVPPPPQFTLVEREVTQAVPLARCDPRSGEFVVAIALDPREFVTEVTAAVINTAEMPLAEVDVLKLEDRSVRLRFTVGSDPAPPAPPPASPAHCPQGQELITLHMRLAVALTR